MFSLSVLMLVLITLILKSGDISRSLVLTVKAAVCSGLVVSIILVF